MVRVTLRSLWGHKRRLISTVLAIVLGVAFMSGTFVLADTLDKVFDDLFAEVNENVDAQVQGVTLFESNFPGDDARQELPLEIVDQIAMVEGVRAAAPFIQTFSNGSVNRIIGKDGDPVGAGRGPPTLIESWVTDERLNPYTIVDGGQPPTEPNHITLNVAAAKEGDLDLGDPVRMITSFGETTYTLVGTFTFGRADSAAGATSANFTLEETQRLAGLAGQTQVVVVDAVEGIDQETITARIAAMLPPEAEAITGQAAAEQTASTVQEGFSFFRQLLTVFAGIALLVGTFIIANTFSILVAQRTRELALLRAVGASRRQVLSSVLIEAAVLGLIAAIVGLLLGIALAIGVMASFAAAGADTPTSGLVVSSTTVVTALVVGLGVTMLAAVIPAVTATRVAPLAALREVAQDRSGASRIRVGIGVVVILLGLYNLADSFRGDLASVPTVGMGAVLLLIGAIIVGPVLAAPTVRTLAAGLPRWRGITGQLATENAARNPKRTSATASALLIAVTLIGFLTIFGASATKSVQAEVERGFLGDALIQSEFNSFGPPGAFPSAAADIAATIPGVTGVSRIAFSPVETAFPDGDTATQFLTAVEPNLVDFLDVKMDTGAMTDLTNGGAVVDVTVAEDHALQIGDVVSFTAPGGNQINATVQAISDDLSLLGFWAIDLRDYRNLTEDPALNQAVVSVDENADLTETLLAIRAATADIPGISVLDADGFSDSIASQITGFLTIVNGLLALSVIIAMIGIANTLSLSIHERTRELGLLRAVGMSRSQLRSAVRWEALVISVLGTLVGLGLGLVISYALVKALGDFGLGEFALPTGSLAFVVIMTGALGVLAAIRPARRAAKLDILAAIATE